MWAVRNMLKPGVIRGKHRNPPNDGEEVAKIRSLGDVLCSRRERVSATLPDFWAEPSGMSTGRYAGGLVVVISYGQKWM